MDQGNKNKMPCICIAHNYTEESYAAMSYHLAHHLANEGYRVLFISYRPFFNKPETIKVGEGIINLYSWPSRRRPVGIKQFIWYAGLYLKYKPNKTIGHFVGSNVTIIVSKILSRWHDKTYIYYHTISEYNFQEWKGSRFRKQLIIYRKKLFYKYFCDQIICPSDLARVDFQTVYNKNKKNSVVLNPMTDRNSIIRVAKNNSDVITISYLGRFDKSKGILELVNAYKKYRAIKKNTIIRIKIAGVGNKSINIHELTQNEPNISIVGRLPYNEVDNYIIKSDYVIIPSLFDNLPTVGLESMMNGVPILLSNQTGLASYISDAKEGYLFYPSQDGIFKVLERVENSIQEKSGLAQNARKTYLGKFTMATYCKQMLQIIGEFEGHV